MRFFKRKPRYRHAEVVFMQDDPVTPELGQKITGKTVHVVADVRVERDRTAWIFEEFEITGRVLEVSLDGFYVEEFRPGWKIAIFKWPAVRLIEVLT